MRHRREGGRQAPRPCTRSRLARAASRPSCRRFHPEISRAAALRVAFPWRRSRLPSRCARPWCGLARRPLFRPSAHDVRRHRRRSSRLSGSEYDFDCTRKAVSLGWWTVHAINNDGRPSVVDRNPDRWHGSQTIRRVSSSADLPELINASSSAVRVAAGRDAETGHATTLSPGKGVYFSVCRGALAHHDTAIVDAACLAGDPAERDQIAACSTSWISVAPPAISPSSLMARAWLVDPSSVPRSGMPWPREGSCVLESCAERRRRARTHRRREAVSAISCSSTNRPPLVQRLHPFCDANHDQLWQHALPNIVITMPTANPKSPGKSGTYNTG